MQTRRGMRSAVTDALRESNSRNLTALSSVACNEAYDSPAASVHASIHSVGGEDGALIGEWLRVGAQLNHIVYECEDMTLFREYGVWVVVRAGFVVAKALSSAQHPVTVHSGEWLDASDNVMHGFEFVLKNFGSQEHPLEFDDFGIDYFVRKQTNRVMWYVDHAGATVHSGAKANRCDARPGVRYCYICDRYFSGNNFRSQHIQNMHKCTGDATTLKDVETALAFAYTSADE